MFQSYLHKQSAVEEKNAGKANALNDETETDGKIKQRNEQNKRAKITKIKVCAIIRY